MARILAFDVGGKRTGVAETDPLQLIAEAVDTIETSKLLTWLDEYLKKEDVECLVIGEPIRMHGEPSAIEGKIKEIIHSINKKHPTLKIEREDERFTSKMAQQAMIESGMKKKKRREKGQIDKVAAVIILQAYMERKSGPSFPFS